jgi:streptogramin lyase
MNLKIFKFFGLGLALVLLGLGISSGLVGTGASMLQPVPGTGIVYITKAEDFPYGEILKPEDLILGTFTTIASGLGSPHNILCGPDGRLYVNDLWVEEGGREVNRILRFNQDGSGRTIVAEWDSDELEPGAMVFAPNGDLYFGTISTAKGKPTQGIWRIPGALQADEQFNPPEQVLPPTAFITPTFDVRYSVQPHVFLTIGPFQGDLLILDTPWQSGIPDGRVLRALHPDFTSIEEFIPAFEDPRGEPFLPPGLAVNSQGDVFVTDFANGKILRYGPNGTFKGSFVSLEWANQIAIGPDDIVYVTNIVFRAGKAERGSLVVYDPEGKWLAAGWGYRWRGVTVCAPQE